MAILSERLFEHRFPGIAETANATGARYPHARNSSWPLPATRHLASVRSILAHCSPVVSANAATTCPLALRLRPPNHLGIAGDVQPVANLKNGSPGGRH